MIRKKNKIEPDAFVDDSSVAFCCSLFPSLELPQKLAIVALFVGGQRFLSSSGRDLLHNCPELYKMCQDMDPNFF